MNEYKKQAMEKKVQQIELNSIAAVTQSKQEPIKQEPIKQEPASGRQGYARTN
jgi:hypothetical protein